MRNLMIFAAILVGLGSFMAQMADKIAPALASANAKPQKAAHGRRSRRPRPQPQHSRDARGHFQTDGRIDGQRIDFMVDTGASLVALNEKSAARFGLRPSRGDYNATVTTANGTIKAARARIAMIDLGGSWCATSTPWCCPTRRFRKTCSACRSCRS